MLETVTTDIDGARVSGSAMGELSAQVGGIIEALRPYRAEFRDGLSVQLGWGPFILRQDSEDAYTVVAPRYEDHADGEITDDLTLALWTLVGQTLVLSMAEIDEPTPTNFDQDVIIANRAIDAERWTLSRSAPRPHDSGWYMDVYPTPPGEALPPGEMTRYPAAQLLQLKKHAVRALFLPPGVAAVVNDQGMEAVFREADFSILAQGPL
ncbi:hypothetical protein [Microbacterium sp. cx-59]|uniref:immunity protein Imm33 domain-containing protein n=1 Tax=Microbacterium sp. cx-59 TaxID=2891207 RepID=UPI001E2BCA4A|nr:hypothetical protein [Microbacterium sp. cx-59]MCC4908947.1 hypothetical protein [Microbacterium sp. cx-59]